MVSFTLSFYPFYCSSMLKDQKWSLRTFDVSLYDEAIPLWDFLGGAKRSDLFCKFIIICWRGTLMFFSQFFPAVCLNMDTDVLFAVFPLCVLFFSGPGSTFPKLNCSLFPPRGASSEYFSWDTILSSFNQIVSASSHQTWWLPWEILIALSASW